MDPIDRAGRSPLPDKYFGVPQSCPNHFASASGCRTRHAFVHRKGIESIESRARELSNMLPSGCVRTEVLRVEAVPLPERSPGKWRLQPKTAKVGDEHPVA